jgi:hypothetical protein
MKYEFEMGSGAKFYKEWFRHLKVKRRDYQTHRQHGNLIILLQEIWPKIV